MFVTMVQKKLFTALALLLMVLTAEAQQVSPEQAADVARSFWTQGTGGRRMVASKVKPQLSYTEQSGDEVQFYVFNNGTGGGFVIVGGDECVPQVLGFSNDGAFDYDRIPDNMKWWLSQYKEQIHNAIAAGVSLSQPRRLIAGTVTDVAPLISTTWDQVTPYNSQLPSLGAGYTGEHALATGCVATAMSQVMNYYQYPTNGIGSKSYTGINGLTFAADFGSTTYDWAHMLESYTGSEASSYISAVATLMYHCGVSVNMNYGQFTTGGSSTDTRLAAAAMMNYFGYDRGIHVMMRDYVTDDDWEQFVYDELSNNRPVIYSGTSLVEGDEGGHAFVCDGYRSSTNMFHINWGWGGMCDGYFLLTGTGALKPGDSGAGGAGIKAEYTDHQFVVAGIQPDAGNPVFENVVVYKFAPLASSVASGNDMPIMIEFHNYSCIDINIPIGIRFTNTLTGKEVVKQYTSQTFSMQSMLAYFDFDGTSDSKTLKIPTNYIEAGSYEMRPVFKNQDGEWQDMVLGKDVTVPEVEITTTTDNLYLVSEPTFGNGNYVTLEAQPCTLRIKNNTAADITTNIAVWFYVDKGGGSYSSVDLLWAPGTLFPAGQVTELKLLKVNNDNLTEGTEYTILVQDNKNSKTLLKPFNVKVNVVPATDINYVMTDKEWGTICLPFEAYVPTGLKAYKVSSYSGTVLNYNEVDFLEMNTPYILNGTPDTYTFHGPLTPAGTFTQGLLVGTTADDATIPVGSYILQDQSAGFGFYKTAAPRTAAQYRAYVSLPSGAATPYFNFTSNESTDIEMIATQQPATTGNNVIYNINGQRMNTVKRGINIVNGKKVLVK